MLNKLARIIAIFTLNFITIADSSTNLLPEGFVYLSDIDPTIIVKMQYYYNHNFIGSQINGYSKPEAILTLEAAEALKKVQNDLKAKKGYSLVVYDTYKATKICRAVC